MSLAAWAESGGASSEERRHLITWAESTDKDRTAIALARLAGLPPWPKKPWRVVVPFPYEDREKLYKDFDPHYVKERIEAAKDHVVEFPLEWLVAIQHSIEPGRCIDYILNPRLMEEGQRSPKHGGPIDHPIVLRVRGVNCIFDGHHRATAAKLLGDRTIPVRLVDLEGDFGES